MKIAVWAAGLALLAPLAASAQTAAELASGETSSVLTYGMGYHQQRYSPLEQINKNTVKRLVPVWNYSFDDNRSEESQPLVYKGVIYVTTHNATMAVDARTGNQIWKTKVNYAAATPRIVCCGIINRGAAIFDGKLFRTTLDANVIALDAKSGKELWRQNAGDIKLGYSMTMAPLVAAGVVVTGVSGAEFGTRGYIDGWEAETGNHLWRTYTVPGPGEPGHDTWAGDTWKYGGGTTWITGSFDPQLNTVYWGTGNPAPFNTAVRPGDNLHTCSVLALDPQTGSIKWHFQFSPNSPFDYDSVAEMLLATIEVNGVPTKVILHADRNGFFYVLDRTNGKLIGANPYVQMNWASGIDLETGRPIETDVARKARAGELVTVWPSILGGKNWPPMSYNPRTGLAYANTLNFASNYQAVPADYKAGQWYLGMDMAAGWTFPDGPRGYLKAIDPMTGKSKWEAPSDLPRFSGTMTTAGGLVFTGGYDGELQAFDADTGDKLWKFKTGSGIEGQPITWEQDGVQYVAVTTGLGGVYTLFSGDTRLASVPAGGSLWAFALAPQ
ncbi:MAG: methanol/ethanol family PQQ-dependent dehydrogenase [Hyphomicrobiales bacterium]|nr:methanol/ethanol family PQQ-dependent dehydrogenase [Hyphomicrobiales bacterium]MBV8825535.1 methanol/ethanol family PQQ-dependent dehydrogenase [Hyphomicrobiales bacterium]MBV9429461.1 methanol/ethanol family PQQ-dependent dehydrogenase [Bradyrhizobiaceae bacterium]